MSDRHQAEKRLERAVTNIDRFDRGTFGRQSAALEVANAVKALVEAEVSRVIEQHLNELIGKIIAENLNEILASHKPEPDSAQPDGKSA